MSILPVSREAIDEELKLEEQDNVTVEVKEKSESEEEIEDVEEKEESELFEKPIKKQRKKIVQEDEEPLIEAPKKRKKRQLSQLQLDNLKKAREKSLARRKELKEAKAIDKKAKQLKKDIIKEEKAEKRAKQDEMIALKAQLKNEAEAQATWTEDRLQNLINNSIDNYIEKKKKMKPVPRVSIPAPQAPNAIGQVPLHPKYYMPTYNQPQQYVPQPQHMVAQPAQPKDPTLAGLFGNYQ